MPSASVVELPRSTSGHSPVPATAVIAAAAVGVGEAVGLGVAVAAGAVLAGAVVVGVERVAEPQPTSIATTVTPVRARLSQWSSEALERVATIVPS
jgi:hypothetical protein